jgi:glucosamine-phosphate N-acetyltransferase
VAVGSIIVERKFLRNAGLVGHIEDIAVSKSMQGRKLGLKIINSLEEIGRGQGLYKIILDCSKDNIRMSFLTTSDAVLILTAFYEKCGYVSL